jgi:hypothetical protein
VDQAKPFKFYAGMCGKTMTSGKIAVIKAVISLVSKNSSTFTAMAIDSNSPWILVSSDSKEAVESCVKQRAVISNLARQVSYKSTRMSYRN